MRITGTHFNYYQICHRKLWLFANGIQMEHSNDAVSDGRLLHESTYNERPDKYREIEIDGIKIDYFDPQRNVIHEVKRSDKMEAAHWWQVKFYIYKLINAGIEGVSGLIEYPKLRKTEKVTLEHEDLYKIKEMENGIRQVINQVDAPSRLTKKSICKKCAYYDFCYSAEGGRD